MKKIPTEFKLILFLIIMIFAISLVSCTDGGDCACPEPPPVVDPEPPVEPPTDPQPPSEPEPEPPVSQCPEGQVFVSLIKECVKESMSSLVNVKDLGAKGDGVADDTKAIRAALAEVGVKGGGIVYMPEGTYNVAPQTMNENAILYVSQSNLLLIGDGHDKTILSGHVFGMKNPDDYWIEKTPDGNLVYGTDKSGNSGNTFKGRGHGFWFPAPSKDNKEINNVTFKNFRFTGNATPVGNDDWWTDYHRINFWDISHKGMDLNHGGAILNNIVFDGLEMDNWKGEIIYSGNAINTGEITIRNCKIHGTPASAVSGPGGLFENNHIYDAYNAGIETYIINRRGMFRSVNTTIRNNLIEIRKSDFTKSWDWDHGIAIAINNDPSAVDFPEGRQIGDNLITYRDEEAKVVIEGNKIDFSSMGCIFTYGLSHALIKNNEFRNCKKTAVLNLWSQGNVPWRLTAHLIDVRFEGNKYYMSQGANSSQVITLSGSHHRKVVFDGEEMIEDGMRPRAFLNMAAGSYDEAADVTVRNSIFRISTDSFWGYFWSQKVAKPPVGENNIYK